VTDCIFDQPGYGVDIQLGHDVFAVGIHRTWRDAELGRDFLVGHALSNQLQDFELPLGEDVT